MKTKVKVLLVLENEPTSYAGIERHCLNIINLYKNDPQIEIAYLCKENMKWHWNKWIGKVVFDYNQLKEKIIQSNCDIVHVHGFALMTAAQSLRTALEVKKKIIYTAHYHPFSSLRHPIFGRIYFSFYIRPYLSQVDKIVAINKDDYVFFKRFNPNIELIPHWITGIPHGNIKRKPNMILFVGRNHSNKGIHYLNLLSSIQKYDINCVTNNSKGISDNIKLHLSIDDIKLEKLYKQASLLVVPSKYEAFSYVALEALVHGTPILMSNNVRIADHLNGIGGWDIFELNNTVDFISKIESTMDKKVDVDKVMRHFSIENIKPKYDNLYKSILK